MGNAPGEIALSGRDRRADPEQWFELLPRQRVQPDTPHRFVVASEQELTNVRLDVFPDGGLARVRLFGRLAPATRADLTLAWFNALPEAHAARVLESSLSALDAGKLVAARPIADVSVLPGRALRG